MQEILVGKRSYKVEKGSEPNQVIINDTAHSIDMIAIGDGRHHLIIGEKSYTVELVSSDNQDVVIKINGRIYTPKIKSETDLLLERLGMSQKTKKEVKELKAPMPGLVLEYRVKPGDAIKEGDALVVLEAMKMENILKAPADATVKSLGAEVGAAIDKNELLITFE